METVKKLWQDSGYQAVDKLWSIVKHKGITGVSKKEVGKFIANQATAELHRKAPKVHETPITTSVPQLSYQADLLDESAYAKSNDGHKWIFLLEDIFSRKGFAAGIKSKSPTDVLPAMRKGMETLGKCLRLTTDSGTEFAGSVQRWCEENGVAHATVEVGDHNSLGMIDSFCRYVKNALAKRATHQGNTRWIDYLPSLIQSYNNSPHTSIGGLTPNQGVSNEGVVRNMAFDKLQVSEQRKTKMKVGDWVRVLKRKATFDKGYQIRYSIEKYQITAVENLWFTLSNDKKYREASLQKVTAPEDKPAETVVDSMKAEKFEHRTDQILKHREGVAQSNKREGLREKAPTNRAVDDRYGKINWD